MRNAAEFALDGVSNRKLLSKEICLGRYHYSTFIHLANHDQGWFLMGAIRKGRQERQPFTMIDRKLINDSELSLRARGLLIWLLDKPDDWVTSVDRLSKQVSESEGTYAIRSALKELEEARYLVRTKRNNPETGYIEWEWLYYEEPQPESENPSSDHTRFTTRGESDDGQTASHIKTDSTKTDLTNTEDPPTPHDITLVPEIVSRGGTMRWPAMDARTVTEILDHGHAPGTPKLTPKERKRLRPQVLEWLEAGHAPEAIAKAIVASPWKTENAIGGELHRTAARLNAEPGSGNSVGDKNLQAVQRFLARKQAEREANG